MLIEVDGISLELLRKPVKNMTLRIYPPDGAVKISVPLKFSEQLIHRFIREKGNWIRTQQDRIRQHSISIPPTPKLQTGTTVDFLGKSYLLIINEQHGPAQMQIKDELLHLYIEPDTSEAEKEALVDRWYRREMNARLPDLIKKWELIIGVQVKAWGIKKMRTRWGSCNTRAHRIWLNLNLIKKPLICLEYVLVHELVHLLEASHNKRFYALMSQFMPQWREYQGLL